MNRPEVQSKAHIFVSAEKKNLPFGGELLDNLEEKADKTSKLRHTSFHMCNALAKRSPIGGRQRRRSG